ncbi:ABC transporter substrate-binding protein [Rhodococcus sp. NPDC058521]|uniref:ABC transporter substrate-binding protein n=1 Tax=Rhodococcus sp. NPDC058521 TaxID=3346536 RepID=UPI00365F703B
MAATVLLLATAAACSAEDSDSATEAGASQDTPSAEFPGEAAAGEAVRIGLINNEGGQAISQPENREAAEAAAKYANENLGGIAGRPIELVICKNAEEPTSARDCGNQMVEQNVSAVVVTTTGLGSIIAPIVTAAGIPYVTALGGSREEITSENSFVLTAGSNTSQAMANFAKEQGWKTAVAYTIDSPAATGSLENMGAPRFRDAGIDFDIIRIPFGAPDATPQVSAGLDKNPDGVLVYGESTVCTSVLKSLNTLGSSAQVISPQTCVAPEVVSAVGNSGVEGIKVFSSADTVSDNSESVLYRAVMEKYTPDTPTQGFAVAGYQGVLGLVRATADLSGEVTPTSIGDAIRAAKEVELPAGDGITFTCDGTAVPDLSSLCGSTMIVLTMQDGELAEPSKVSVLPE